jgi:hemerythrin-like metal-binding protein
MPVIVWKDEMSVGVKALDAEHRNILEMMNQLHDDVLAGAENKMLVSILTELIKKTKAHLDHEETMLAKTGYPGNSEHHKAHDAIIAKGLMLQARFMSGSEEPFTMAEVNLLHEWLGSHLCESDKLYAQHLNAHGIF